MSNPSYVSVKNYKLRPSAISPEKKCERTVATGSHHFPLLPSSMTPQFDSPFIGTNIPVLGDDFDRLREQELVNERRKRQNSIYPLRQ